MRGIVIFVLCIAAVGAAMGGVAAGVKNKKVNIFKTQAGAWLFTIVMVIAAINIGYAKSPLAGTQEPRPDVPNAPASADSYVWDDANVLSGQTERVLNERNGRLWDRYSVTIGVVTCNYGRADLGDYALRCAEDMGLGGYDMIVVLDISGDNYWLLLGDSLTSDCSGYASEYMEYWFVRGDYDNAVLDLTEALERWYGDHY